MSVNEIIQNICHLDTDCVIREFSQAVYPTAQIGDSVCFYRVEKLSYDEDYPKREAFENALAVLDNDMFNLVYVLTGKPKGVELCLGVMRNSNRPDTHLPALNVASKFERMIEGNFGGSVLRRMSGKEIEQDILLPTDDYRSCGMIVGIPSVNERDNGGKNDSQDFQGIDRLINSMMGKTWRLVVIAEPVPRTEIESVRHEVWSLYDQLALEAKLSEQTVEGENKSTQTGSSHTDGEDESSDKSWSETNTNGSSEGNSSSSTNKSNAKQEGESAHHSKSHSDSISKSDTSGTSHSSAITRERTNKRAQEIMKYIDEELLARLKLGLARGLFRVSVRGMAADGKTLDLLLSAITSLFQGNTSSFGHLRSYKVDVDTVGRAICRSFCNLTMEGNGISKEAALLFGRPLDANEISLSTYLTSREASLYAGLPQREVPGIPLIEAVEFGLNYGEEPEDPINLGSIIHNGRELRERVFAISRRALSKHIFIGGVTGSGKTTTCQRLLVEARKQGMHFLVIEPAKTEYRELLREAEFKDLLVLTPGNEGVAPFRLNPFELIKGENISSHIDMIKATFTAAFPMEGSMPQMLEEAIIECYSDKCWNVLTGRNDRYYGDCAYEHQDAFPRLSDLTEKFQSIVDSKGFGKGTRLAGEYIGSLVSRLSNLLVGAKGAMLNCEKSLDFAKLLDCDVVIEMEDLRSPEDKALIMGFVLSCMSAAIKQRHKENCKFKHITLVEEAHRLLTQPEYGDHARKAAVETFTDLLAEIRKYGEGLIVVDQIPNKLASEVLKNTNTKIIHKLFAKDDKDAVGDTMLMTDKQRDHLSALKAGDAVVFADEMEKPVLMHVDYTFSARNVRIDDVDNITDEFVSQRFVEHSCRLGLGAVRPLSQSGEGAETKAKHLDAVLNMSNEFRELLVALADIVFRTNKENQDNGARLDQQREGLGRLILELDQLDKEYSQPQNTALAILMQKNGVKDERKVSVLRNLGVLKMVESDHSDTQLAQFGTSERNLLHQFLNQTRY